MNIRNITMVLFRTALVISATTVYAQAFTGDVAVDFSGPNVEADLDATDVGLPPQAPGGTVSGWEIDAALFELDIVNDALLVGLDFAGIAGDADGDGDPSNSAAWLLGNGGLDLPDLAGTESICVAFDFDNDLMYDVIAGVSGFDNVYSVSTYTNGGLLPFSFGTPLPMNTGANAIGPDFELEIANLSTLVQYMGMTDFCINYSVFSGSYADDGIGEDFMMGQVCLNNRSADTQDIASDFSLSAAYPNPFNPTTTISFNMPETGLLNLSVYNMAGQKVTTLVNGITGSGSHEVIFDASNLSSGVYFYSMKSAVSVETRKMILTK